MINEEDDVTVSVGEIGTADDARMIAADGHPIDVVVGEIPDAENLTRLLWTAQCEAHGLLGTFEARSAAEECRHRHLCAAHGRGQLR